MGLIALSEDIESEEAPSVIDTTTTTISKSRSPGSRSIPRRDPCMNPNTGKTNTLPPPPALKRTPSYEDTLAQDEKKKKHTASPSTIFATFEYLTLEGESSSSASPSPKSSPSPSPSPLHSSSRSIHDQIHEQGIDKMPDVKAHDYASHDDVGRKDESTDSALQGLAISHKTIHFPPASRNDLPTDYHTASSVASLPKESHQNQPLKQTAVHASSATLYDRRHLLHPKAVKPTPDPTLLDGGSHAHTCMQRNNAAERSLPLNGDSSLAGDDMYRSDASATLATISCSSSCSKTEGVSHSIASKVVGVGSPLRIITRPLHPAQISSEAMKAKECRAATAEDADDIAGMNQEQTLIFHPFPQRSDLHSSKYTSDHTGASSAISICTASISPCSLLFTGHSTLSSVPSTANSSFPSASTSSSFDNNSKMEEAERYRKRGHGQGHGCGSSRRTANRVNAASSEHGGQQKLSHMSNYEYFSQNCAGNRPPLLRSVTEDAPVSIPKGIRPSSPSRVRFMSVIQDNMQESQVDSGVSVPMGQRSFTAPAHAEVPSIFEDQTCPAAPSAEGSSIFAGLGDTHQDSTVSVGYSPATRASISSQSSSSLLASSEGTSWHSPQSRRESLDEDTTTSTFAITKKAYASLSDKPAPAGSFDKPVGTDTCLSYSNAGHSPSFSLDAALPLSRTSRYQLLQRQDRRSPPLFRAPTPSSSIEDASDTADATSKLLAKFDPQVADAIRQAAATVRSINIANEEISPAIPQAQLKPVNYTSPSVNGSHQSLMGSCGNGYFGNAIRIKATELLNALLPSTAANTTSDVVSIIEYGSLNSLSSSLVPRITSHFDKKTCTGSTPSFSVIYADGPDSDFRPVMRQVDRASYEYPNHHLNPQIYPSFVARPFPAQVVPPKSVSVGFSLMDLHCRRTPSKYGLSAAAAAHNELQAFLHTRAVEFKKDGLLLLAFIQRQEDESIAAVTAARSKRAGDEESADEPGFMSPLANRTRVPLRPVPESRQAEQITPTTAQSNTSLQPDPFSSATSSSSMHRRRSESSPCRPFFRSDAAGKRTDIWSTIPALLAPCIQRLVTTGLIKSDTASHLLTLPVYPRTPNQTKAVLRAVQHQWRTEWSCGLPAPPAESSGSGSPSTPTPLASFSGSGEMPHAFPAPTLASNPMSRRCSSSNNPVPVRQEGLILSHPAYTAFQSTTLSQVQFAEHAIQFIRVLYEAHFRTVLHDHAKLSRSRVEEVLDSLNEVLREKIEEPGRMLALELEVCIVALRRL